MNKIPNYPKDEGDGRHIHYVKTPIENEKGKYVCVDVHHAGYFLSPAATEFDTEDEAQKACNIHNDYHGWSKQEADRIIWQSMKNSN